MRVRLELFLPTTAANTEPGMDTFFVLRGRQSVSTQKQQFVD